MAGLAWWLSVNRMQGMDAVLFALGAMSLVWMAVRAGLIALERIARVRWWSRDGRPMSIRIGSTVLLLALAVALAARPASPIGPQRPIR